MWYIYYLNFNLSYQYNNILTWLKELGSLSIYSQFGMTVETVFTNNSVNSMSALDSVVLTSL